MSIPHQHGGGPLHAQIGALHVHAGVRGVFIHGVRADIYSGAGIVGGAQRAEADRLIRTALDDVDEACGL